MRTFWALVAKDLRRRRASPAGLVLGLALPLVLSTLLFLAFGRPQAERPRAPTLRVLVLDLDDSPLSRLLSGAGEPPDSPLRLARVASREDGLLRLQRERAAALLVVPKGFGDALVGGPPVELELVKNPAQALLPVVAERGASVLALYLSIAARLIEPDGPALVRLAEGEGWDDPQALAALLARARAKLRPAQELLLPPLIEVQVETPGKRAELHSRREPPNVMVWVFPGLMAMGLLFVSTEQMADLLREGLRGTLRRQLVAPLAARTLVLAKVVVVAIVATAAAGLFLAIGRWGFGLGWGSPALTAAACGATVLAVTGFAAALYAGLATPNRAEAVSNVVVMLMSLLGGSFVPLEGLPAGLQQLARLTPTYWLNLVLRGLARGAGAAELAPAVLALAGLGIALTLAAAELLRRRHGSGAL